MTPEKCPHCGMAWDEWRVEYGCGSYPAGSSVVRATACTEIARLRSEVDALRAGVAVVVPEIGKEGKFRTHIRVPGSVGIERARQGEYWVDLDMMADRLRAINGLEIVPASRVLKDGEMPIKISEWERIQAAIAKIKDQHDPVKMAERVQRIADEHKAARQPQKGPPFKPVSILLDVWTTTHGTAQDGALRAQGKEGAP